MATPVLEKTDSVPAHVPAALVFDFDIYNIAGLESGHTFDVHALWKRVQDSYPALFWTPRYGGHWIVTRAPEIRRMQSDYEFFSNSEPFMPRGVLPLQIPEQLDPPAHGPFRKLFMPAFLPRALVDIETKARRLAQEIIDALAPQGECEFVRDFAGTMPIIAFLTMMNLPEADYAYLRGLAILTSKPTHPESPAAWAAMSAYVRDWITRRRAEPAQDLITSLINAEVDSRPLTDDEIFSMSLLLLGGGLDTVASMTSFIACFLAQSPAHRRALIEHPERLDVAVEECARRFGTSNLARLVRADTEMRGQRLHKDDMIVGIYPLAGLDENENPDPLSVDFTRAAPRHVAFGSGPHVCPGAVLARREIKIFLTEWLARIPDFSIKPDTVPAVTTGLVNSMNELHLVWDPAATASPA